MHYPLLFKKICLEISAEPGASQSKIARRCAISRRTLVTVVHTVSGLPFRELRLRVVLGEIQSSEPYPQ